MIKRVVIAGSRNFNDYELFCSVVDKCLSRIRNEYELVFLSGHCSGADMMAERYAKENGFGLEVFPADWSLGRKAGPIRNKQMVDVADFAIAFPSGGRGTQSLINFANEKGIPHQGISCKNRIRGKTMKRLLCLICLLSLLLTACASNDGADKTTKEYEHIPYVSSIEQKDCFLCGEPENALADLYWGEDNVAIINLNTFEFLRLEINRYDDHGNLLEEKAGYMQMHSMSNGDCYVHASTDADRAYSHVQIKGEQKQIDAKNIQSHLCQTCLDTINDMYFGDYAPSEYAVFSFTDRTIRPFIQNVTWFTFGDYGIECDSEENGDIDLFVVYCPPRYTQSEN